MSDYYFRGYITNLGKYNEGELIGKWITFPITKQELDKALEEIGINENYEEWFFTDFDGKYPCCVSNLLCEYSSVSSFNKIALALDKVAKAGTGEEFEGFLETKDDFFGACANAIAGNGVNFNCQDSTELAHIIVDEMGGAENLPKSTLAWYFDYESYGRDIRIDFYNEEEPELTAGEFWCGDENATDKEIGEAVIESCGLDSVSNICYYFDYETYGNDIMNEGDYTFTDNGLVDCSDYDDTLGEDFEKALEEELSEKEKEEER